MSGPANLIVQRHQPHDKVLTMQAGNAAGGGGVGIQLRKPDGGGGYAPPAREAPPPSFAAPPGPSGPPVNEEELIDTMNELANPLKKSSSPVHEDAYVGGGDFAQDDDEEEGEEDEEFSEEGDDEEEYEDDDGGGGGGYVSNAPVAPPVDQPSEGFRTLEEEKSDILFKLQRLQRQGIKGLRQFTPYSDVRDMRSELNRVRTELELERSVKFQRKILMAIVSALEWGNSRFNPFDLELDGWSEQMHQSVQSNTEYDGIFEELYFKYRNRVSTPPEVRLLLMVGGSAMMFHMTKAMMKSALPSMGDIMRQNPAMMDAMMKSFAPAGGPPQQSQEPQQPQQQQQPGGRREMRGPGVDIGGLGGLAGGLGGLGGGGLGGLSGGLGNLFGNVPPPPVPPAGINPEPTRRDRVAKAAAPQAVPKPLASDPEDSGSERLSDVVSEDLESLPDDFSVDGSVGGSPRVKNVHVSVPPTRGRAKRARTAGPGAKVITI